MHFSGKDQSVKIAPGSADAFDDCLIRNASPWISRQTNKIIILNSNQDIVEQVYAHICKNYDSPLKINELANQFGISRSRLFTRFKERYGKTPKQFILIVKIDKAKQMLDETDDSVSEIAQKIGFGDYFTFEKAFKKATGLSLTEWRKRNH
ncbi:AraC family transcriptional regulator [uncultured Ligilactobacillus sp.]|uniref:helix-turn-helix domain-containing protein n=1 Tax=uncultured Ligilactobacillus sp. TaxID=2837633 RepID=UPI00258C92F6|nr:AraC family transcriptional regulator [uncultured Ligilactobacillus sp.]